MISPHRLPLLLAALLALLGAAGCASFDSRAAKYPAVIQALPPATVERLKAGEIHLGDSPPMVYLALGRADSAFDQISAAGRRTVWTYTDYWQEYQGTRIVGYRRLVVYDPATKSQRVLVDPDYQAVYAPRAEDRLKVTFENDRVVLIEQSRPDARLPADASPGATTPTP